MEINEIKSYSEGVRELLGLNYYNASTKKALIKFCNERGYDIVKIVEGHKHNYCKNCGKEIPSKNKFCSSSCAASYNNKGRILSEETKRKIGEGVLKHSGKERKMPKEYICKNCGKHFISMRDAVYCSSECVHKSHDFRDKIRQAHLKSVQNGTHKGWVSRKIISYSEKFWMKVLDNNNIKYEHNFPFFNKYFLDFYIVIGDKKIDLEIDGKQHKLRKEHDLQRDMFVKGHGVIVYRIDWNTINNEKGKQKMKYKIEGFLQFIQDIENEVKFLWWLVAVRVRHARQFFEFKNRTFWIFKNLCYLGVNWYYKKIKDIIEKNNIDISHFGTLKKKNKDNFTKLKDDEYFALGVYRNGANLLKRLLQDGYKEHKSERCGRIEWEGQLIPIQVHHINGDHFDNRIENLQLLCPNCHSLTDTFCRKKYIEKNVKIKEKKSSKKVSIEAIVEDLVKEKEDLINAFKKYKSFVQVGKYYGVSDNAIRKRCKKLGILEIVKKIQ